jgi:hypothetical protein
VSPEINQQLTAANLGTVRIDRASFATYADPLAPKKTRLVIRLTGQIDHQRLAAFLRSRNIFPGEMTISTRQVPLWQAEVAPESMDITLITSAGTPWGAALVGDTDVVLVRAPGNDRWGQDPQLLLDQVMRAREGQELGIAVLVPDPPSGAGRMGQPPLCALLEGRVSELIKGWPEVQEWFPVLPRHVSLQVTRDRSTKFQSTKFQLVLSAAKPGDEQALFQKAVQLKQQAATSLERVLPQVPDRSQKRLLSQALAKIKVYFTQDGAPGGKGRSNSVGATWDLSPDEWKAFENLLKYLP